MPNIFMIPYPSRSVNPFLCSFANFRTFHNLFLFTLYNIPSCKIKISVLDYIYKEVIPMYR